MSWVRNVYVQKVRGRNDLGAKRPGPKSPGAKRPGLNVSGLNVQVQNVRVRNVQVQKDIERTCWSKKSGGGTSWTKMSVGEMSGSETSWSKKSRGETSRSKLLFLCIYKSMTLRSIVSLGGWFEC